MGQNLDGATKFLDAFAESWARGDGGVLADQFTVDASLINPFGQRADGRDAISAMYAAYFAGMLAGTSTTIKIETARAVGDDSALIDAEQEILAADGSTVLVVHLTALLTRAGEEWRFVDSRPYTFAALPG